MLTVIKWVWNIVSGVVHSQSFSLLSIHDMLLQHSFRHIQCRALPVQPSAGGFVPQHCQLDQQLGQQLEVGGTTAAQNQPSPARKVHFHVALPKALGMHLAGMLSGPHTVGKSPEINARAVIPCNRHFDGSIAAGSFKHPLRLMMLYVAF